jgi:TonB-dependent starch-binding outer membrane protein SusC
MYCERLLKAILLPCLLLFSLAGLAQEKTISGKVTDSKDGSALPGVSVSAKGSTNATQTKTDGTYKLTVSSSTRTLVFTSVGYGTQEVSIDGRSSIDIQLVVTNATLGEVVVTGYGTARKKDLTGSITQISSKDFQKGPQTTPLQLIQGKVPGVQISTGNGMPGAGIYIRIRQGASLNASNDPLIVVDGVPLETGGISGVANPLALLNPNDIESMNILKDASATAIFGNRASNGVIIITTKKGTSGKLKVSYNTNFTLSTVTKTADILDATEFKDLVNAQGTTAQKALLGTSDTKWQDEIYRNAFMQEHNMSFSGGIKKFPYRLSLGYMNQDGILKMDNLQRGTMTININPKLMKNHLSIDINMKNSVSRSQFANQGAIGSSVFFDPTQPIYNTSKPQYGGYWEWELNGLPNTLAPKNPLSLLNQTRNIGNVYRSIGNIQFDYKFHFLPELRANLNLGYDVSKGSGKNVSLPTNAASYYNQGSQSRYSQTRWNYLSDFYLNYAKNYTEIRSRVDFTLGYGWQDWTVYSPSFPTINGTGVIPAGPAFKSQHTLLSAFSRLNYGYDDRFLLTATIRRDGSSRFSEENRYGLFPSAALAWRISRESFMRNSKTISDLKLRFGWGITGQQDVGSDYPYLARYTLSDSSGMYQFGSNYYLLLRPEGYDENLKWETTETYNAGIDVGLFNGRVNFSVDAYFKRTKDLLAVISVPAGSNLTNQILTNVGNIENQGLEFAVSATPIRNKDFTWDLSYNFTYNTSEITNLSKIKDPNAIGNLVGGISGGVGNTIQIHTVGYAPFSFYVYKQVYDQNGKPIEGLYVDGNKDGASNDKDKYRYKNPQPKYFMGLSSQFGYKKWSLSFAARASFDNYIYNNFNSTSGTYQNFGFPNYLGNVSSDVLNTGFTVPRLWSDYYIENASFVRMDNINLGYNVGKIGKKSTLRVSANVQNVFVITKYSGLDPEIPGGIDNNFYPRPRTYALGFNLDF